MVTDSQIQHWMVQCRSTQSMSLDQHHPGTRWKSKAQAQPRPTETETGVKLCSLCFNKQVILRHTQVWEPGQWGEMKTAVNRNTCTTQSSPHLSAQNHSCHIGMWAQGGQISRLYKEVENPHFHGKWLHSEYWWFFSIPHRPNNLPTSWGHPRHSQSMTWRVEISPHRRSSRRMLWVQAVLLKWTHHPGTQKPQLLCGAASEASHSRQGPQGPALL